MRLAQSAFVATIITIVMIKLGTATLGCSVGVFVGMILLFLGLIWLVAY